MRLRDRERRVSTGRDPRPPAEPTQEQARAALVADLAAAGIDTPSACGTCGGRVSLEEPDAVQTTREQGRYPNHRQVKSWRYHRLCYQASGGPALLALVLDLDARPIRVTQAHADVARRLDPSLAYRDQGKSDPGDRGRRRPWEHLSRSLLEDLRRAVAQRERELTEAVHSWNSLPCSICGASHALLDDWKRDPAGDKPLCGPCAKVWTLSRIPGNLRLPEFARQEATAAGAVPAGRLVPERFPIAADMPDYRALMPGERRRPWAYLGQLPLVPPTDAERLAELERRLAEAVA